MEKIFLHKKFSLIVSGLIFVLVIIAYSNTFNASFHFDDTPTIVENPSLRNLGNLPEIIASHRGVTMATFALNYAVGKLDVTGYHVVNTAIHIINGILAYFVVLALLKNVNEDELWCKKIAAFSALLFAVHPIQTQAVTYIVQRMESLSSLFYLASLLLFIKGASTENSGRRTLYYVLTVVSFILAFKSKEIAITLPVAIALYDYYFVCKGNIGAALKQRWPVYAALSVLLLYFAISTIAPLGGFNDLSKESSGEEMALMDTTAPEQSAGFGVKSITPTQYLYTQFNVIVYYISLLLVPVNQNLDYDFPVSKSLFEMPKVNEGTVLNIPILPPIVSLFILLAIVGVSIYILAKSKKTPLGAWLPVSFFILWFFLILSPTSSFIPIIDVIFEHRVYLPSLGFFVIFCICLDWIMNKVTGQKS